MMSNLASVGRRFLRCKNRRHILRSLAMQSVWPAITGLLEMPLVSSRIPGTTRHERKNIPMAIEI